MTLDNNHRMTLFVSELPDVLRKSKTAKSLPLKKTIRFLGTALDRDEADGMDGGGRTGSRTRVEPIVVGQLLGAERCSNGVICVIGKYTETFLESMVKLLQ